MAFTTRYVAADGTDTYANSTNSATPCSLTTAFANQAAGDWFKVKEGTYTRTGTDTPTGVGTTTSPIVYEGVDSSWGSLAAVGRTSAANPVLVTTNFPVIAYDSTYRLNAISANFVIYLFLRFTGAVSNPVVTPGTNCFVYRNSFTNSSTNASASCILPNTSNVVFDCDSFLTGASGGNAAIVMGTGAKVDSCVCKTTSTTAACIKAGSAGVIFGNLCLGLGIGIQKVTASHALFIRNNTCVDCVDAIDIVTTSSALDAIIGNMLTDASGNAIDLNSADSPVFLAHNRLRDPTTINGGTDWVAASSINHVTADAAAHGDYNYTVSTDFTLKSDSPAKAANWFAFSDIGALQREEAASGGSTPAMFGFM